METPKPNLTTTDVVPVWDWILTFILTSIPLVNIVMLFIWAFNSNTNPSKANWAKAALILFAITLALYLMAALFFGSFAFFSGSAQDW
jgi:membrane protein YdbS with pleckstrin-like domain